MSDLNEPSIYKRLHALVRIHGLDTFVETGCGPSCVGLRTAIALGLDAWSCDINAGFVEEAKNRYGVAIHASPRESQDFLRWVIPEFIRDKPTLFFLDAHFPDYPDYLNSDTDGVPAYPLLDELQIIRDLKPGFERDVILCDDIRCIEDLTNPRWDPKEMDGSNLVQRGISYDRYKDVFKDTHSAFTWCEFEGILAFVPRGA